MRFIYPNDEEYGSEVISDVIVIDGKVTLQIDDEGQGQYAWAFRDVTGMTDGILEVNISSCRRSEFWMTFGGDIQNIKEFLSMTFWQIAQLAMCK
ncbi:MAG: hypothetical protein AB2401_12735 [Bacillus sp. (in: firmicutes)]